MTRYFSFRLQLVFILSLILSSCASVSENFKLVENHFAILRDAELIEDILKKKGINENLREKLFLVNEIKDFSYEKLSFKRTSSYSTYVDIEREAVVWNIVATKPNSFDLKEWCYFFVGCFNYKGFFRKEEAKRYANNLVRDEGLEIAIFPVPAYSTLGWSDFFGGDPVLNTFIWDDEISLVRLLIHEMAHQQIFVRNDTMFNESFASYVENVGTKMWVKNNGNSQDLLLFEEEASRKKKN